MNLPKDVFILRDPVQIKHALMILIHNAIDSMAGMDEKYLMLDAATYDECVVLILADNGPMIPVEDRSKFFDPFRSEEHTSELQSLMRISYAVLCLKNKLTSIRNRCISLTNITVPTS